MFFEYMCIKKTREKKTNGTTTKTETRESIEGKESGYSSNSIFSIYQFLSFCHKLYIYSL